MSNYHKSLYGPLLEDEIAILGHERKLWAAGQSQRGTLLEVDGAPQSLSSWS